MSLINVLRGEEPGFIHKLTVQHREGVGGLGEYLTEYALKHGNLPGRSVVLRNVLVPRTSGPTGASEIDVLMLHETGIYVLESKNYSGWIFGSADDTQWTQSLEGGQKKRFYNPIIQNRAHVKALADHLGLQDGAFFSYIVFSERCELKKVPADTADYVICKRNHLLKRLRRDLKGRTALFGAAQFDALAETLARIAAESTDTAKAEHVEQVQKVSSGEICPRCGGELVRRKGRYGEFLGCKNYPRCTFTRNIGT